MSVSGEDMMIILGATYCSYRCEAVLKNSVCLITSNLPYS